MIGLAALALFDGGLRGPGTGLGCLIFVFLGIDPGIGKLGTPGVGNLGTPVLGRGVPNPGRIELRGVPGVGGRFAPDIAATWIDCWVV